MSASGPLARVAVVAVALEQRLNHRPVGFIPKIAVVGEAEGGQPGEEGEQQQGNRLRAPRESANWEPHPLHLLVVQPASALRETSLTDGRRDKNPGELSKSGGRLLHYTGIPGLAAPTISDPFQPPT